MTGVQKVIKYIAIALAMFIIVNICVGILFGLSIVVGIFELDSGDYISSQEKILEIEDVSEMKNLDIQIKYAKLNIKSGNMFKIESNDTNIYCVENNDCIQIRDRSDGWMNKSKDVTVYIPTSTIFDDIKIQTGAGKVEIELLKAKKLQFEVGAGSTKINQLDIMNEAKINAGAGSFIINSGTINNLKLELGAGKTEIKSEILGNSKIESGIGKLDLKLIGEDYQIETENGIGAIRINGDKVSNESKYGNGDNKLKVEGGIGAIDIDFVK